jgi:hypothetical protein
MTRPPRRTVTALIVSMARRVPRHAAVRKEGGYLPAVTELSFIRSRNDAIFFPLIRGLQFS